LKIVLEDVGVTHDAGLPSEAAALREVSVSLSAGERLAVVGPTGSGKTTLLEVMAGLAAPTSGRVFVDPPGEGLALRSAVGLAYQFPESQFFEETVYEDVAFGPVRQGVPPEEIPDRVCAALRQAGLSPTDFADRSPLSLSAGEKRRAAIAGILALGRPFLLLDEPTAGLDPATAARVEALMIAEADCGVGVAFVTHDLELVERAASRVVILSAGEIVADGETPGVLADGRRLRSVGLEPPPRCALLERLNELSWPEVERVARLLAATPRRC
jgi:energy-coupling factor transport system ATP-binding protein